MSRNGICNLHLHGAQERAVKLNQVSQAATIETKTSKRGWQYDTDGLKCSNGLSEGLTEGR
ncbi:unnamed protein product [Calypogeia fissa]